MRIRFDKIDGFIRVCGGEFRYLVLFDYGLFDRTCDKIKYLISEKSGITDSISLNFEKRGALCVKKLVITYKNG